MSQPSADHAEPELMREIVRVLRMGSAFQAALHGLHAKIELPAVLEEQERRRVAPGYAGTANTPRDARAARSRSKEVRNGQSSSAAPRPTRRARALSATANACLAS